MKTITTLRAVIILASIAFVHEGRALGQSVKVVPANTPDHEQQAPYDTWDNAATNITAAVTYAGNNGIPQVLISNGWYLLTDTVKDSKGVHIRSFNEGEIDREGTIIDGNQMRGFQLSHANSVLEGLTVTNCFIHGTGAAVLLSGGGLVENCDFIRNRATAPHSYQGSTVCMDNGGVVRNCRFIANDGGWGGAVAMRSGSTIVSNCFFDSNIGIASGGAIFADNGQALIVDSFFTNNMSRRGGGFHSVATAGLEALIDRCVFVGNIATNTSDSGSSARGGGGLQIAGARANVTLRNSLIMHNTAPNTYGGGICIYSAPASLIDNCTVVSNYTSGSSGAITVRDGAYTNVVIRNTIVDHNWNKNNSNPNVTGSAKLAWTNNCVSTGVDLNSYGSGNLLNVDPLFTAPTANDWRPRRGSPCINAGFSESWMSKATDLVGTKRMIYDVDIGCYEFPQQVGTYLKVR